MKKTNSEESFKMDIETKQDEKSILKVMNKAYQIAESSGFYFPYRKYDWLESSTE